MKSLNSILFLLFMLFNLLLAQNNGQIVRPAVASSVDKFKPGQSFPIAVVLHISEPFHINSNEPTESYLIPTTLRLKVAPGITLGKVNYPQAELKQFSFSDKALSVYEGTVYLFTTLSISPDFEENVVSIEGTVSYQACNNQACFAPEEVPFNKTIRVAGSGQAVTQINQQIFSRKNTVSEEKLSGESGDFAREVQEKGLFLTFILVFLGGLALNLTPCVYPLIPITISYFGGQAKGKKGSLVSHAVLYVLGMAITYSVLGLIAAFTGGLFGAALQNPVVLVGIAIVLVVLALSMFDLYEIRIPAFLSNFAGGSRQGYPGTFFMGLTVGIVAAPCIGPFVLALLTYVGEKGNPLLGFSLFFVLALGLGIPFLFLGIFSGSMNKIPRSGGWMIWVRSIFGFVLIAMALYFLAPLFPGSLSYHFALALIMLIGGIYMAWIEPTPASGKIFPAVRNIVGVIFFLLALYFATTGVQSYLDEKLSEVPNAAAGNIEKNTISWVNYSENIFADAKAGSQPVMLDFFADWCIPCKELDKFTFRNQEVIDQLRNFITVKVNLTKSGDPLAKALKEKYRIKGVPTLLFLSSNGEEIPGTRVVGFIEKDKFLPVLEKALQTGR